jgi:hypothetical protein
MGKNEEIKKDKRKITGFFQFQPRQGAAGEGAAVNDMRFCNIFEPPFFFFFVEIPFFF